VTEQHENMSMAANEVPLTANNTIAELLATHPVAARVLIDRRMHCVGCDVAPFETIRDACAIYGVAIDEFLEDIRRAIATRKDTQHADPIFGAC
jgi:hybrid cluster-associated redox disulfide protein